MAGGMYYDSGGHKGRSSIFDRGSGRGAWHIWRDSNDGNRMPNRESLILRVIDAAMTVLTVICIITSVLMLLVPNVPPARLGVLPVLALVAPLVYVVTVMMMLYWIIRWRWRRASVMTVLVVVGMFYAPRYYIPQFRRSYDEDSYPRSAIKVMSYNLRGFFPDALEDDYTTDSIAAFVLRANPDIICFQECWMHNDEMCRRFDSLLGDYRKSVLDVVHPPIAIYSRFKILGTNRVAYLDADSLPEGKGMWADLLIGSDTVRVFNVHLNGTSINRNDVDYIVNYQYMSDSARNSKLYDMIKRLNVNTINRSYHVDALVEALRETDRPKILCGDFNDTPMSYAYNSLSRNMKDAFRECGHGYSHTFRRFFDLLRIDFALFDEERFDVLSYEVPDSVCWSDHLPVCVRAELRREI